MSTKTVVLYCIDCETLT